MTKEVLLIVEKASHRFRYYDMQTKQVLREIPLSDFPHEFVVSPDEKYAYIGVYGVINSACTKQGDCQVYVLDIANGKIVNTLQVADAKHGPMYRPHGVQVDAKGGLYVLSESGNRLFYKQDPLSGTRFDTSVPTGGMKGHLFALTKDGNRAFVSNLVSGDVTAINPHDENIPPTKVQTGEKPEGRCLSPDEKTLFITNRGDDTISVIDVETMTLKFNFGTPADPTRAFYDTKRDTLMVVSYLGMTLSIYKPTDGALVHTMQFQSNPTAFSFMEDNNKIIVPFMDKKIRIFDMQTYAQVDEIDSGEEPDVTYVMNKSALNFV